MYFSFLGHRHVGNYTQTSLAADGVKDRGTEVVCSWRVTFVGPRCVQRLRVMGPRKNDDFTEELLEIAVPSILQEQLP